MAEQTSGQPLDPIAAWRRKVMTSKQSPQTDDQPLVPPLTDDHTPHADTHSSHTENNHLLQQKRPFSRLQNVPWEVIEQIFLHSAPQVPWHQVSRAFRKIWSADTFRARLLLLRYGKAHAFYWALSHDWLHSPQLCDALESKGAILSAHFIEYAHSIRYQVAEYPQVDRWLLSSAEVRYGPDFYRQEGTLSDHEHWVQSFTAEGVEDNRLADSTMRDRPVPAESTPFFRQTSTGRGQMCTDAYKVNRQRSTDLA